MSRRTFQGGVQVIDAGDLSPEVAAAVRESADQVTRAVSDNLRSILFAFVAGLAIGYSLRRDAI